MRAQKANKQKSRPCSSWVLRSKTCCTSTESSPTAPHCGQTTPLIAESRTISTSHDWHRPFLCPDMLSTLVGDLGEPGGSAGETAASAPSPARAGGISEISRGVACETHTHTHKKRNAQCSDWMKAHHLQTALGADYCGRASEERLGTAQPQSTERRICTLTSTEGDSACFSYSYSPSSSFLAFFLWPLEPVRDSRVW